MICFFPFLSGPYQGEIWCGETGRGNRVCSQASCQLNPAEDQEETESTVCPSEKSSIPFPVIGDVNIRCAFFSSKGALGVVSAYILNCKHIIIPKVSRNFIFELFTNRILSYLSPKSYVFWSNYLNLKIISKIYILFSGWPWKMYIS